RTAVGFGARRDVHNRIHPSTQFAQPVSETTDPTIRHFELSLVRLDVRKLPKRFAKPMAEKALSAKETIRRFEIKRPQERLDLAGHPRVGLQKLTRGGAAPVWISRFDGRVDHLLEPN